LHKPTSTVREALLFSAHLRQPLSVSNAQKNAMVEEIIDLLEMRHIVDALVGSVESGVCIMVDRKRLSIGLQLAATPEFLLLDEPTSALDCYAAFQIIRLLRNLADKGMSILVVIHQPSALLFDYFDKVAFLGRGGRSLYFGQTGQAAIEYFERNGAIPCGRQENPPEYLLEAANGLRNAYDVDWFDVWKQSAEYEALQTQICTLRNVGRHEADSKRFPTWKERFPIVLQRFFHWILS
jgi:ATP-binding cassette subfamily G (WHITE) protein 2 (SNQ2)